MAVPLCMHDYEINFFRALLMITVQCFAFNSPLAMIHNSVQRNPVHAQSKVTSEVKQFQSAGSNAARGLFVFSFSMYNIVYLC